MKNVLIIDAMNLIHRARVAMQQSENGTSYAAFRMIRSLVNKFDPKVAYLVIEGKPRRRIELSEGTYKAQRESAGDAFWNQQKIVIDVVSEYLPIFVTKHPDHEADDVIAYLANTQHSNDNVVIVSTDTDFIQLLDKSKPNLNLYSPIKDIMVSPPEYDYVKWKALRGDGADNIPGIPGIGDKRAANLLLKPNALQEFFKKNPSASQVWEHNCSMIKFESLEHKKEEIQFAKGKKDNDALREKLRGFGINSMTSDKSWPNWSNTFNNLWLHSKNLS
jgi:DNA polymerase-1